MPKRKPFYPSDDDQSPKSKLLRECAQGIGQAAIAWNQLHEELRDLFVELFFLDITINAAEGDSVGMVQYRRLSRLLSASWNSVGFDRPKREMIKDVLSALSNKAKDRFPKLAEDVTWILREATNLEESRNNLIHSPIGVDYWWREDDMSDMTPVVVPRVYGGNHRALKLMEKDLLTELVYCRDMAMALKEFVLDVSCHIGFLNPVEPQPWPKRPPLPKRERQSSPRGRRRPNGLEELSPQDRKYHLEAARRAMRDD